MRWRGAYLAILLLLVSRLAGAGETVLVLDVSQDMDATCPSGDSSLLEHAIGSVRRAFTGPAPDEPPIGLVTFAGQANVLSPPTDASGSLAELVDGLTTLPQTASLFSGLAAAHRLLEERGVREAGHVRILTSGNAVPAGAVRSLFSKLRETGVKVEIEVLVTPSDSHRDEWSHVAAEVRWTLCADPPPTAEIPDATETSVRNAVAKELVVPPDTLGADTDLVDDLGVDRATAFDILARICDEHDVSVPESGDLTSIGAIANYVAGTTGESLRSRRASAAYVQTVYYATDRMPKATSDPRHMYSGDRSRGGQIRYGACDVSIPLRAHKPGSLETPFLRLEYLSDKRQHVLVKHVTPKEKYDLFEEVTSKLESTPEDEDSQRGALIYIPGFSMTFDEVARKTAQMPYDLGFAGATFMFSWPSDGNFLSYLSDREDMDWSASHIDQFLTDLVEEFKPRKLHLVAHGMGNEGLLRALTMIALRRDPNAEPIFENVILAAPDLDAQTFTEQTAPRVHGLSNRWTVYVSDNDGGLDASSNIRYTKLLGRAVTPTPQVDTIDATGTEVTPWSVPEFHSYYATKQLVVSGLVGVLQGLEPANRGLQALTNGGHQYWSLQEIPP